MTPMQMKAAMLAPVAAVAPVDERPPTEVQHTYIHQIAGANTILPNGTKLEFAGRTAMSSIGRIAGFGYYTTNIPVEIDWLESLVRVPSSQITKLLEEDGAEKVMYKQADPAIKAAYVDAAKNSENQANPAISSAAENLGNAIAASGNGNQ